MSSMAPALAEGFLHIISLQILQDPSPAAVQLEGLLMLSPDKELRLDIADEKGVLPVPPLLEPSLLQAPVLDALT